jgi:hypothetical protein
MKLGQDLESREYREIENFFGLVPLIRTNRNELKLSFDRLLKEKSDQETAAWLKDIYQAAGRTPPKPDTPDEEATTLLLEQLQLSFPGLGAIHQHLSDSRQAVGRSLRLNRDAARQRYFTVGKIVVFLLENSREITLSELGARFCNNSKSLRQGELKNMVEQWLCLLRPDLPPEDVWQEFLVIRDRLTITALVYVPLIYEKNGREYDWINQLYQAGEPAVVSWFHLDGITSCRLAGQDGARKPLITCENEAPFSQLLREDRTRLLLFTSGFPNRAVRKLYQFLAPLAASCCHWGDSDPAGLRIGAILHRIHPLVLWRCELASLERHQGRLLSLTGVQAKNGRTILENEANFPFIRELVFTLEHGWLEQENWKPDA